MNEKIPCECGAQELFSNNMPVSSTKTDQGEVQRNSNRGQIKGHDDQRNEEF